MGNHEHYHGKFDKSAGIIRDTLGYLNIHNVYLLDRETKEIDGVHFIGGTLWTDCNKGDGMTLYHLEQCMNDFRVITNSTTPVHFRTPEGEFKTRVGKFSPEDSVEEHVKMKQYIQSVVQGNHDTRYVVVGHHAPSGQSTHDMYAHDTIMNGGYSSALDEFIMDHPQIKLWTHGHTHHPFDYTIGETRVVCNPRGYSGHEVRADEFALLTVEV
jgi:hypothetical protein